MANEMFFHRESKIYFGLSLIAESFFGHIGKFDFCKMHFVAVF